MHHLQYPIKLCGSIFDLHYCDYHFDSLQAVLLLVTAVSSENREYTKCFMNCVLKSGGRSSYSMPSQQIRCKSKPSVSFLGKSVKGASKKVLKPKTLIEMIF